MRCLKIVRPAMVLVDQTTIGVSRKAMKYFKAKSMNVVLTTRNATNNDFGT